MRTLSKVMVALLACWGVVNASLWTSEALTECGPLRTIAAEGGNPWSFKDQVNCAMMPQEDRASLLALAQIAHFEIGSLRRNHR